MGVKIFKPQFDYAPPYVGPITPIGSHSAHAEGINRISLLCPSGTYPGDLIVAHVIAYNYDGGGFLGAAIPTTGTGWHRIGSEGYGASGLWLSSFYKVSEALDHDGRIFTFSYGGGFSNGNHVGYIASYRGVNATQLDVAPTSQAASTNPVTIPALTTVTDGAKIIAVYGGRNITSLSQNGGQDLTEIFSDESYASPESTTRRTRLTIAVGDQEHAGSSGAKSATKSAAQPHAAMLIALRPA